MSSVTEKMFKLVMSADPEKVTEFLESSLLKEGEKEAEETVLFTKMDDFGRNVLLIASMMGKSAIVRELVSDGAEVNMVNGRGYSSLHLAACWGHLETVQTLIGLQADALAKTFKGEKAVDLARKYSKTDCVEFLLLAEAKQDLASYIASVREKISQSEKKLTKDEKATCSRLFAAKSEWIQNFEKHTVSDFTAQRTEIENALQNILNKLAPSP